MLTRASNARSTPPRFRLWMAGLILFLLIGLTYIVVSKESTTDEPVPSPNFKSEEELGP